MSFRSIGLDFCRQFRIDRGGAYVLRSAGCILRVEIVKFTGRDDLNDGQRLRLFIAEYGYRYLHTLYELLYHHRIVYVEYFDNRLFEILDGIDDLHAERRPFGRRFNDAGQSERFDDLIYFNGIALDEIKEALKKTDINTLTPIEAMNLIFEWKKKLM